MQRYAFLALVISCTAACSADDRAVAPNPNVASAGASGAASPGAGIAGSAGGYVGRGGSTAVGGAPGDSGAPPNAGAPPDGGTGGSSPTVTTLPITVCPPAARAGDAPTAAPGINIALNRVQQLGSLGYPNPAQAFDGNASTDTDSAKWSVVGYLTADLGAPVSLSKTVVKFGGKPTSYRIQGSNGGCQWTDILRVACPSMNDAQTLPAATYRYVRFAIDTWSVPQDFYIIDKVNEIEVYARGPDDPPAPAQIVYPAPLDRTGWVASAYANSAGARDAIDSVGVPPCTELACYQRSNWDNGHAQEVGQWFQIDMGKASSFNYIEIDNTYDHPSDVPVSYDVFVSDNGADWGQRIADGEGAGNTAISFPTQQKRYLRIVLTAGTPAFWRIADFNVFNTAAPVVAPAADCL